MAIGNVNNGDSGLVARGKINQGIDKLNTFELDTDVTLSADSDSRIATQKATKAIVDTKEDPANKDATGGYVGLTLFKINFKNLADTFVSFFVNNNTAARTYTLPDKDGTVAMTSDINGANIGGKLFLFNNFT